MTGEKSPSVCEAGEIDLPAVDAEGRRRQRDRRGPLVAGVPRIVGRRAVPDGDRVRDDALRGVGDR